MWHDSYGSSWFQEGPLTVLHMFIRKIRELSLRYEKLDKIVASEGEIKNTDYRDRTLNPCEQSITKDSHRLGNSTILLKLNSLSGLNYSVNFFFFPSSVCKSCQGRDCQIRIKVKSEEKMCFPPFFSSFEETFLR